MISASTHPLYHMKSLSIFTLSSHGLPKVDMVTLWSPTFLDFDTGPAIVVDCGNEDEQEVHKTLLNVQLGGFIGWEGPRRSLGSKGPQTRSVFTGYFDKRYVSALDISLYVRKLCSVAPLQRALIGSRSLFTAETSLLIEMGEPGSVLAVLELVDEVVLASPRLAIVITSKSADIWATHLTDQYNQDPLGAITKVRYRQSQGGRPFAKPGLLDSSMNVARARATASSTNQRSAIAVIEIQGMVVIQELVTIQGLMDRVAEMLATNLTHNDGAITLNPNEWKALRDHHGRWDGRIQLEMGSQDRLNDAFSKLHGAGVEVNGMCHTMEVENPHGCLERQALPEHPSTYWGQPRKFGKRGWGR